MKNISKYNQITDAELWADFLQGSRDAYAFIYHKYARTLYNYGYKIAHDRDLTEDCLQDLFLTILESRERLGQTDSIKFYLMRSLRREIIRKIHSRQRLYTFEDSGSTEDNLALVNVKIDFYYEPTWLDAQISKERSATLLHELNLLPARQKEALFLKFFDNLSYQEIAGIMGLEQASTYKLIYKAIASLQKRMPIDLFIFLLSLFF